MTDVLVREQMKDELYYQYLEVGILESKVDLFYKVLEIEDNFRNWLLNGCYEDEEIKPVFEDYKEKIKNALIDDLDKRIYQCSYVVNE
jgi:hypothetical protein